MRLHFKQLSEHHQLPMTKIEVDMTELLTSRSDCISAEPVQVTYTASLLDDIVTVEGSCQTSVEFVCARCLCQFKQPLDIPFKETFSRNAAAVEEDEEQMMHFVTEEYIDLTPHIEENAVLGLPFIPLCKSDCLGLCAMCGVDKNEQQCECKNERIDPRLAGLATFFDE